MSIKIEGSKGNVYDVDWNSCTCPHYKFRCMNEEKICKHIEKVRNEHPELGPEKAKDYDLKVFETIETDKLPYTEEELKDMVKKGLIIYNRRIDKYTVLQ